MSQPVSLTGYHRILLLTDGYSTPFLAKTAISILRYRTDDVIAVFDHEHSGTDCGELFSTGHGIPVVDVIPEGTDAIFIGIAPPGGKLPATWRPVLIEALAKGIDIISGLHDFLSNDTELVRLAEHHDCRLIDVRKNDEKETATGQPFRDGCLRIHTIGQDCTVGKMVASIEVQRELARRGHDAKFLATGQTGIMISGEGIPIDCVVSDFVNGAAERLVRRNDDHEIVLIEGQGCLSHPSFSAVTLGLLHGSAPQGLIFVYEVGRTEVKGLDNIPLRSLRQLISAYETAAALRHPSRVIGIAMNGRKVSDEEAAKEKARVESEFGLPTCDVYRDGAGALADAVETLQKELSL
ncbi:DUF1611 domain-containing protein [Rhodopirellula sp. MGV]|uniref:DUF1611 domain-containing protein n=1 Tax=Rhodopirellula sp. MGV TaxID=2023130 RepID=UPI000B978365|nr:DUF1611 domain-containing protein [Rhodopirellula sp. MGV]OYP34734.1 hypothetical protein CGZ80_13980 [Rhodopirellula sp. MGV]PNY34311.1 DUF1611 domain-containing protein [Rhodopirellula baltica]